VISLLKLYTGGVQYGLQVNVFFMDAATGSSELLIIVQVQHISCMFLIQLLCLLQGAISMIKPSS